MKSRPNRSVAEGSKNSRATAATAAVAFALAWLIGTLVGRRESAWTEIITVVAFATAVGLVAGAVEAVGAGRLRSAWSETVANVTTVLMGGAATLAQLFGGFAGSMIIVALALRPVASASLALLLVVLLLVLTLSRSGVMLRNYVVGAALACVLGALTAGLTARLLGVAAIVAFVVLRRVKQSNGTTLRLVWVAIAVPALGIALVVGAARPAGAKSYHFTVPGKQLTFTAVDVPMTRGRRMTITAKGKVTFLRGEATSAVGPDGAPANYSGCDGPGYCGGLIGRQGDKGTPIAIGKSYTFVVQDTSPLQLAINDYDSRDNIGSFDVTIETGAAPTPTLGGQPPGAPTVPRASRSSSSGSVHILGAVLAAMGALLGRSIGWATGRASESVADAESASEPEPEGAEQ